MFYCSQASRTRKCSSSPASMQSLWDQGWPYCCCTIQDEATCCALGQKSYNELVIQLVTTLGGACTPKRPAGTPRAFSGRQHGSKYAAAAALAAAGAGAEPSESLPTIQEDQPAAGAAAAVPSEAASGPINAEMLSVALQGSLHVAANGDSGGSGHGAGGAPLSAARPSFASSNMSFGVSESMRRLVDDLMQGVVQVSRGVTVCVIMKDIWFPVGAAGRRAESNGLEACLCK